MCTWLPTSWCAHRAGNVAKFPKSPVPALGQARGCSTKICCVNAGAQLAVVALATAWHVGRARVRNDMARGGLWWAKRRDETLRPGGPATQSCIHKPNSHDIVYLTDGGSLNPREAVVWRELHSEGRGQRPQDPQCDPCSLTSCCLATVGPAPMPFVPLLFISPLLCPLLRVPWV